MVNDGSLKEPVFKEKILDKLGNGYLALDDGLAAQASAYFAVDKGEQMGLYGSALSSYSKAQLSCQMVTTTLKSIKP